MSNAATAANAGDTAWVLTASALVLFMTLPGLALFYGGLVRSRNLLSVLMHCFVICCIVSVLWVLFAYSLAFDGTEPLLGGGGRVLLAHLDGLLKDGTIPEGAFALFQMTFAVITPALIVGAFAERISFSFLIAFAIGWLIVVYAPVAHWVWGGGWLADRGTIDFAGGIVVHTTAGISALVCAIAVGPRRGFPDNLVPPHSPGLTMAGAGMLWFGWFGFNGGSALAANGIAVGAILATHCAAAAAALTWMVIEWFWAGGKPTSVGIVTGSVAGLATVTPASGYVGPAGALAIGILAGAVCFIATGIIKRRLRIDDTLDVFAVHGVGGMLGSLAVAVLMAKGFGGVGYAAGTDMAGQFLSQLVGVAAVALWSAVCSLVLIKAISFVVPLRISADEESVGLDLATHGERAYDHG